MSGPIRGFSTSIVMRFNERMMSVVLPDINNNKRSQLISFGAAGFFAVLISFIRSTGSVRFHRQGRHLRHSDHWRVQHHRLILRLTDRSGCSLHHRSSLLHQWYQWRWPALLRCVHSTAPHLLNGYRLTAPLPDLYLHLQAGRAVLHQVLSDSRSAERILPCPIRWNGRLL